MKYSADVKKRIVNIIRDEYVRAVDNFRHAHSERVGLDAAANIWDDFNPQDGIGGIKQNPYNTLQASRKEEDAKTYAAHMKAAYDCAVDTFLEKETE